MRTWLSLLAFSLLLTLAGAALAQEPAASSTAAASEEQRLAEAKPHFLRGVQHTERGEWDAALVEFLRSRELFPTTKATYNAAVCLRKLNRFDEALDMYEALLREFPNLAVQEKQVAIQELAQLKASIGVLELRGAVQGAKITIDGRDRGTFPPGIPLRVGAGSHAVRVSADGYLPFEANVGVAGTQTVAIDVQMVALTSGGRLRVAEQTGKALDVVVDNSAVGKTPWEGLVAPGDHMVFLRGEGNVGTEPVLASVKLNQVASLKLLAEQLDASIRIQPTPPSATVIVDSIPVGRGTWEGRLRPGAHAIEATADGYLSFKRGVDLKKDAGESIAAVLERDPSVFAGGSAALGLELDAALPLGLLFGGSPSEGCSGSCSAGIPLGAHGVLHGIYQGASGFGVGVDVGYLVAFRTVSARNTLLQPNGGLAPNAGTADDKLRLGGLTVGASAQYRTGEEWPVLLRVGLGALLGSVSDTRSGSFTNSLFKDSYDVNVKTTPSATYLYVAPELRVGHRFGKHFELNVGAEILLMTALSQPKWKDNKTLTTTAYVAQCPPAPMSCAAEQKRAQGDGAGGFASDSIAGNLLMFIAPGVGARYDF